MPCGIRLFCDGSRDIPFAILHCEYMDRLHVERCHAVSLSLSSSSSSLSLPASSISIRMRRSDQRLVAVRKKSSHLKEQRRRKVSLTVWHKAEKEREMGEEEGDEVSLESEKTLGGSSPPPRTCTLFLPGKKEETNESAKWEEHRVT